MKKLIFIILVLCSVQVFSQKILWTKNKRIAAGLSTTVIKGDKVAAGQGLGMLFKMESLIIGFESIGLENPEYKWNLDFVFNKNKHNREGWRFIAGLNYCSEKKYRIAPEVGIMGDFRTVKPLIILDAFYPSLKVGILFDL